MILTHKRGDNKKNIKLHLHYRSYAPEDFGIGSFIVI